MSKYILFILAIIVFSGCTTNKVQENAQKNKENIKKVIVKLIRENKEFKNTLEKQERRIVLNQDVILQLKEELKSNQKYLNKNTKSLKHLANQINSNNKNINNIKTQIDNKKIKIKNVDNIVSLKEKTILDDLTVEVVVNSLNLRETPSLYSPILSKAQLGDTYKVIEKSHHEIPWYKVLDYNEEVWLYSKFVKPVIKEKDKTLLKINSIKKTKTKKDEVFRVKVDVDNANLRFKPNLDSKIVATANKNEIFRVLDIYKGEFTWYKIIKDALPVWVYSGLVKKMKIN